MAEIKNSFLQSKMNKDLDDRLIPNGEYRDALNVSVGKAEDKDIGALEAVLGNDFMIGTGNNTLTCIGQVADNQNNRIVQFWTDYTDINTTTLLPPNAGDMRITLYDVPSNTLYTLVSGVFLNFAANKDFRIYGANILEDLLFWTDNRNQPRKINITKALTDSAYYNDEVQISVAKFSPVAPINVYLDIPITTTSITTHPTTISTLFTVSLQDAALLNEGMQLIAANASPIAGLNDYAVITNLNKITGEVILAYYTDISLGQIVHFYGTSMTNKADEPNWPGDPNYLKDKYVRFSYRYRFDDGEYSLMAPFTQSLFIPNQNGYFIDQDENSAYRSTILSWMENYVNNAGFHIELPNTGNYLQSTYKIISLDILYKESDSTAVKVLETISSNQIKLIAADTNLYTYIYRSQKPYKTLPEAQTVRVYDKVPVRAKAQEITGNRVIYGNFINQTTPPSSINYNLSVIKKSDSFTSWAEYPNHTLKQNRNYQAGIILADKFGRQSSVILSTNDIDQLGSDGFIGSTIYSSYYAEDDNLNVKNWRGNTLAMRVNSPIVSEINDGTGTPGLYAIISGEIDGSSDGFQIDEGSVVDNIYDYSGFPGASQQNYPKVGDYLRGKYTDYVRITEIDRFVFCDGPISDIYNYTGINPDIKYAYRLNQLGWYSYKVVVRQQQQDYYNAYLPGMLNGYPMFQTTSASPLNATIFPIGETNKTAHIVLINDNINKIPRDLTEVGPDQKQYRSSVELFGRVENTLTIPYPGITSNKQYYPTRKADTATTIAASSELNFLQTNDPDNINGTAQSNFYQLSSTPIIARVSTVNRIGVIASNEPSISPVPPLIGKVMIPYLSVYETAPVVSLLDLFWESSSTGLISDLNADVLTGSDIAIGFDNLVFDHYEFQNPAGTNFTIPPATIDLNPGDQESPYITSIFRPVDSIGVAMNVTSMSITVEDLAGANRTANFVLESFVVGLNTFYAIKINNAFVFLNDASRKESYIFTFNIIDLVNGDTVIKVNSKLNNSYPVVNYPAYASPIEIFSFTDIVVGPIISCLGTNGAPATGNPEFNKQQLQWSIASATPSNWADHFSIDPVYGVISLTNITVPTGVSFNITIRLADAYNFTTNQLGANSRYTDRQIVIVYPTEDNHCGSWESSVFNAGIDDTYSNFIVGKLNFWKLMRPGETINTLNSIVRLNFYSVLPLGSAGYATDTAVNKLTFSTTDFYGDFSLLTNQDQDTNAAYRLYFLGNIETSLGRTIPIDIFDKYTSSTSPEISAGESCTIYIPVTNKNWKLINNNSTAVINWTALESDGITVIGGSITPGNEVGSSFYGGEYTCIKENSLTYGEGGLATYSAC